MSSCPVRMVPTQSRVPRIGRRSDRAANRGRGRQNAEAVLRVAGAYSAPTTWKPLLTKTWCGQLTPIMWTLYSPLLNSTTRLTVPPG